MQFESMSKVTLIVKSSGSSYISEGNAGVAKFFRSMIKAEPPHVVAKCTLIVFAEHPSQISRLYIDKCCQA